VQLCFENSSVFPEVAHFFCITSVHFAKPLHIVAVCYTALDRSETPRPCEAYSTLRSKNAGRYIFWAPNGTCLSARCHFTVPKKLSISRAQPPPTCPCWGLPASKAFAQGCINHRCIGVFYVQEHTGDFIGASFPHCSPTPIPPVRR
jgi:hypothetical protein